MKYLVDSLQRHENDYGNALCPVQNEPDQSFMGEHAILQPVTVNEFRMFGTTIMSALKTPESAACTQLVNNSLTNPIISIPTPTSTGQPEQTPTTPSQAPGCLATSRTEQTAVSLANTIPLTRVCIPDLPRSRLAMVRFSPGSALLAPNLNLNLKIRFGSALGRTQT